MKITLEGCKHIRPERYGNGTTATCLNCYHRLRAVRQISPSGQMMWVDDYAPGVCYHINKKSLTQLTNYRAACMDALCIDCGRVLRHPDGAGQWTEVISYGYVIKEESW